MRNESGTIAAISTAMSNSGIGIVRMSGEEAVEIAERIYKGKNEKKLSKQPTHTIHYGYIVDGEDTIDESACDADAWIRTAIQEKILWKSIAMVVCMLCEEFWRR